MVVVGVVIVMDMMAVVAAYNFSLFIIDFHC